MTDPGLLAICELCELIIPVLVVIISYLALDRVTSAF
jgi:hypothetical protein